MPLNQTVVRISTFAIEDLVAAGRAASKGSLSPVWQGTDGEHSHWTLDGLSVNRLLRDTIGAQESKLDKDRSGRGYLSVGQGMMRAPSKVLKASYHPMARRSDRTESKGIFRRRVQ